MQRARLPALAPQPLVLLARPTQADLPGVPVELAGGALEPLELGRVPVDLAVRISVGLRLLLGLSLLLLAVPLIAPEDFIEHGSTGVLTLLVSNGSEPSWNIELSIAVDESNY